MQATRRFFQSIAACEIMATTCTVSYAIDFFQSRCLRYSRDPKQLWEVIRSVSGQTKLRLRPLPPLDSLNCYFAGLVSDCTVSHIPPCGPANESHFTAFSPVSLGYIQKLLEQLDTCKAPGSDELLPSLLRSCAGTLAPSFTHHVNKSLSCGVFPAGFKNLYYYSCV